jgi:hypothetical protein
MVGIGIRGAGSRRSGIAVACLLGLLAAGAAAGQSGPCGIGNVRNTCFDQDEGAVTGAAGNGDEFGAALAFGDFDGDGRKDLAVGVPGEDAGIALNAGLVQVFYGTSAGLATARQQAFDQDDVPGDDGGTETGDQFGFALAAGDFDGDGFDDLAIGSPFEAYFYDVSCGELAFCEAGGLVHVVFGSSTGLVPSSAVFFGPDTFSTIMTSPAKIGYALAAGRFSGGPKAELLIGAPGVFNGLLLPEEYGAVDIYRVDTARHFDYVGGITRIGKERNDRLGEAAAVGHFAGGSQSFGVAGCPECDVAGDNDAGAIVVGDTTDTEILQTDFGSAGSGGDDLFGSALAVGDFDGDGRDDLAIGAPGKDDLSATDSGRVYVAYGSASGLDTSDFQILRWNNFPGQVAQDHDELGAALAAGDYDGDGRDDLFLGSPNKGSDDRGFVYFLHGSASGLVVGAGFNFSEPFLLGTAEADAHFGAVLAMGDLDGDGTDELAIGVPDKDSSGHGDAGMVYVTRALDPHWLFGDGFEGGSLSLWSAHQP